VFATRNHGKVTELEALLSSVTGLEIRSLAGFTVPEVIEDGDTFAANATKKALEVSRATGYPALADDSGLEVDALGGAPGVYSARYAGEDATDGDNNRKLLTALQGIPEPRRARFRSVVALADVAGGLADSVVLAEGTCEGEILAAPRGTGGFGYDPLFFVPELGGTFAELGVGTKNEQSHRARAFQSLRADLLTYFHLQ